MLCDVRRDVSDTVSAKGQPPIPTWAGTVASGTVGQRNTCSVHRDGECELVSRLSCGRVAEQLKVSRRLRVYQWRLDEKQNGLHYIYVQLVVTRTVV